MKVDVLLDLSGVSLDTAATGLLVETLSHRDGLAAISGRTSCILSAGMSSVESPANWRCAAAEDALALSSCALEAAARERRPLLVLRGPIRTGNEPVSTLCEALHVDPMFGFAVARVSDDDGQIAKLSAGLGDPEIESLPRAVLAAVPEYYIIPEAVGACFLVRLEVVSNLGVLHSSFATTAGAWLHYLCRARRAGFRGVIVNRAVVFCPSPAEAIGTIGEDYWKLHREYPDTDYARQEFQGHAAHEHEALLARAVSPDAAKRKTLLIDARGLPPKFNGTADCILGLLDGLAACDSGWAISVLVKPDAGSFHRVAERFPTFEVGVELPERRFTVALRVSQPWDLDTVADLHHAALVNCYLMLDTISWDILYNGTDSAALTTVWRFVAEYADGICYISDFTRQRFATRFPPSPLVRHAVTYLPLHASDYVTQQLPQSSAGEYMLVVGNDLDHKWVTPTVEFLATAFPFQTFQALGCGSVSLPNVTGLASGDMSEEEIRRLYANARVVIFPSFYEGFGFPIVAGLSHGKAVVARKSSLLEEVAARCRANGRLYAFTDNLELLDIVAQLVRGDDMPGLPLGGALLEGDEPLRWRDIAGSVLDFLGDSLRSPDSRQWLRRANQLRFMRL